ncbi:AAA family ATPase [Nocardia beijingensis]
MAACLSAATSAVVISSDSVRAGLRATGSIAGTAGVFGAGAYRSAAKALVYAQMFSHARQRLEHGLSVILDASWTDSDQRARAAALADETRNESHHPFGTCTGHRGRHASEDVRLGARGQDASRAIAEARSSWTSAVGPAGCRGRRTSSGACPKRSVSVSDAAAITVRIRALPAGCAGSRRDAQARRIRLRRSSVEYSAGQPITGRIRVDPLDRTFLDRLPIRRGSQPRSTSVSTFCGRA